MRPTSLVHPSTPGMSFSPIHLALSLALGIPALHARGAPDARGSVETSSRSASAAIDRYAADYLDRTGLPGAAIVITRGSTVVHARGYGADGDGRPVTSRTPMPVASLSKSFTALALLQLAEQGLVALDTAVVRYLPDFALADRRFSAITVRQLLDHTSGMSDMTFREKSLPQPASLAGAVERLRVATLADDPGTAAHYHNPNYQVAARLVEVVSGEPFGDYLLRHVFTPLGMTHTSTVATTRGVDALARGHVQFYGVTVPADEPSWFLDGSSGVITTAEDIARWLIVHAGGRGNAPESPLVSPEGLRRLHGDAASASGEPARRGLGWTWRREGDGGAQLYHAGWLFTATASQVVLPAEGYGIAVMANRGIGLHGDDADRLARGVISILRGEEPAAATPLGAFLGAAFALVTLGTVAMGVRALRRSRRWAERHATRPLPRLVLLLAPLVVPAAVLARFPEVAAYAAGGRDASWFQLWLMAAPLIVWFFVAALLALAVLAARLRQLTRLRQA